MTGIIFDIKRYAVHDGPGIRTTVFLKGCPLRCWWCHNPESFSVEIIKVPRIVMLDGKSIETIETIGKEMHVKDLMDEILKDTMYYEESGGGVTFSGGEPLMQTDFLQAAIRACKEAGLHVAVDTSGVASQEQFERIIDDTDLFLYDIKHLNDQKHQAHTGVSNRLVLDNLAYLLDKKKDVIIRYPVIPGINDDEEQLAALVALLKSYRHQLPELHLLPYHAIARGKYERFKLPYKMNGTEALSKEDVLPYQDRFTKLGLKVKIGG